MQINTVTERHEIMAYTNITIYTIIAIFVPEVQKTTSEEDCENQTANRRNYISNIFTNFCFVSAIFFVCIARYIRQ
jgi:hypothetical protein